MAITDNVFAHKNFDAITKLFVAENNTIVYNTITQLCICGEHCIVLFAAENTRQRWPCPWQPHGQTSRFLGTHGATCSDALAFLARVAGRVGQRFDCRNFLFIFDDSTHSLYGLRPPMMFAAIDSRL